MELAVERRTHLLSTHHSETTKCCFVWTVSCMTRLTGLFRKISYLLHIWLNHLSSLGNHVKFDLIWFDSMWMAEMVSGVSSGKFPSGLLWELWQLPAEVCCSLSSFTVSSSRQLQTLRQNGQQQGPREQLRMGVWGTEGGGGTLINPPSTEECWYGQSLTKSVGLPLHQVMTVKPQDTITAWLKSFSRVKIAILCCCCLCLHHNLNRLCHFSFLRLLLVF